MALKSMFIVFVSVGNACQLEKWLLNCYFVEFGGDTRLRFVVVAGDSCASPRTHAGVSCKLSTWFPAKVSIFIQYLRPKRQYPSIIECFQGVWGDFERIIDAWWAMSNGRKCIAMCKVIWQLCMSTSSVATQPMFATSPPPKTQVRPRTYWGIIQKYKLMSSSESESESSNNEHSCCSKVHISKVTRSTLLYLKDF